MVGGFTSCRHQVLPKAPVRRRTRLQANKVAICFTKRGVTSFGFKRDFESKYEIDNILGVGSFGTVYVATDKRTQERFAVKRIKKRYRGGGLDPLIVKRVHHEVDILSHLGHSLNVVHMRGAYEDDQGVNIVMEICRGGNLQHYICRNNTCTEADAAHLIRDILRTVAQCHTRGVIIRDVKPENYLFIAPLCSDGASSPASTTSSLADISAAAASSTDGDDSDMDGDDHDTPCATSTMGALKMIDFGLATYCKTGQALSERVGSVQYVAPEVLRMQYGLPADVWSAGVIAYQLLAGRLPFRGEDGEVWRGAGGSKDAPGPSSKELFRAILYSDLDFSEAPWDTLSADAKDLVQRLLQRDPALRPSAIEALHHRWLQLEDGEGEDSADTLVQRLQRFGTYGRLKQAALKQLASSMGMELRPGALLAGGRGSLAIKLVHATMPSNSEAKTGTVDSSSGGGGDRGDGLAADEQWRQVEAVLRGGGYALREEEIRALLEGLQGDEEGVVDPQAWTAATLDWGVVKQTLGPRWEERVQQVFDQFDRDHSGALGSSDLSDLLCGHEEQCEVPDTVPAAMREAAGGGATAAAGISREQFSELVAVDESDSLELFDSRRKPGARS